MSALRKLLFPVLLLMGIDTALSTTLNVTAINAHDGKSHFECWSLSAPFFSSSQAGIVGTQATQLGDVTNMTYGVISPGYDAQFHTAPYPQWVVVLNGLFTITLPDNSSDSLTLTTGESGLLFAMDTPDISKRGHGNYIYGPAESIFLQIPTPNGSIPEHELIYSDKPCGAQEFSGLREQAT
ncbi:hypothetical protein PFICI_11596 [Pestalotiopsis fici W106-1]|uniref:Small secreted protein n=1 Tax=Pestalotiopsis fici (strain W106-1 / CGMCC3.15140) TaxID=1229662 RepID=W3WQV3_PESFW|nr:uncharacterized protein PFICI_11596 [Pestalotiopsis fici W106-1]ETS76209.1 hypothetical protein PFICI_11596 [Pestalotiopsis fici W106-1]